MLSDTRTSRRSGDIVFDSDDQERQQFLVGEDEDEDPLADEVRSFRSSASMDEQDGAHDRPTNTLMSNASARMSHIQVGDLVDEQANGAVEPRKGGGLAAKAGVILVSNDLFFGFWAYHSLTLHLQGIHNIFIVMPQMLMTAISSILFAILEPRKATTELIAKPPGNETMSTDVATSTMVSRAEGHSGSGPESYAIVFK